MKRVSERKRNRMRRQTSRNRQRKTETQTDWYMQQNIHECIESLIKGGKIDC